MSTSACIASRIQCSSGTVFRAIYKQGKFLRSDRFVKKQTSCEYSKLVINKNSYFVY